LFGQLSYVLTGPISNLLKSLEKSRIIFITYILGGVSNLILNLLFVPRYGIVGAAVGTSVATIIVHGSHYIKVDQEIKIDIFDFNLVRAGGAAVIAAIPSLVAAPHINGYLLFVIHILFFSILYTIWLYLLGGIDKQDLKQIYQAMV
jgi:O-antigen/teichoic acid export membrane protein